MANPLVGVWELVSDEEDGLLILTDSHFTDLTVRKERAQWPVPFDRNAVTDEMRAEAWNGVLFSIGGTYEIVRHEGTEMELLFHPTINRLPMPLRDFTHQIVFEGDEMSGDIGPRHEVWRRVS